MTKVVYNNCYGGFGLSAAAYALYCEKKGIEPDQEDVYCGTWRPDCCDPPVPRHDPTLVSVVEELGERANGTHARLSLAEGEGPYRIDEYDGSETVIWRDSDPFSWIDPDA